MGALFISLCVVFFALCPVDASTAANLAKQPICVISEEAPCSLVNDTVNVVSGAFSLQMRHLAVPGHVPLDLVQYYNSHSSYTPWLGCGMSLNYCFSMVGNDDSDKSHDKHDKYEQLIAESPGGSIIRCLGKSSTNSKKSYYLDPAVIHEGFTNCGSGNISARTNLKNVRLKEKVKYEHGARRAFWTCYMPDGSVRKYYGALNRHDAMNVLSEQRADGTRLEFDYYKRDRLEGSIKQITAKAKSTLNWLKFESSSHSKKAVACASNGKKATFSYFEKDDENYIYKIDSSDNPTVEFCYDRAGKHYCINKVLWPEGRFLEIEYDGKGRVVSQKAPVGSNEKHTIWRFKYYDDKTKAYDANGNKKVFHHKSGRITSIQEYAKGAPYRSKAYYWGAKSGLSWAKHPKTLEGNLMGHAVLNEEGCGTSLCYYEYDDFGNITKETTCGNLTGRYPWAFWIDDNGRPKDTNVEKYHKFYKYNAKHLLTYSSEDNGPSYEYRYIAGKDLPWAKFVKDGEAIILREFYSYDEDGILTEKIVDNGVTDNKSHFRGVTHRFVTQIQPVRHKEGFGQGLPQEVKENYVDLTTGQLVLVKHTHYNYTKAGQISEEAVFDALDRYRYSIWYDYDHMGRLHRVTNPIKDTVIYTYDANGNKKCEKQEGVNFHTIYQYDKANRCLATTQYHYDNTEVHTSQAYDFMGNRTSTTDRYGHTTHFEYDACNRVTKITYPDGSTTSQEYDLFDNVVKETNENGHVTTYEYTIRKQPSRIIYPDGTEERFEYNKNGTLCHKWDQNHTRTSYTYDILGRVIKTAVYDAESSELSVTTSIYNAHHLLSTTDAMGHTTHYEYDDAGRKIKEWQESSDNFSKTTFAYDTLGRLVCTKKYSSQDDYIATELEYDYLNRIILERQVDGSLKATSWTYYAYDKQGNCTVKRSSYTDEDAEQLTRYNSKSEPVEVVDEEGYNTQITYDHNYIANSQKILRKITTDTLGATTEECYDVRGRLATLKRKNPQGALIAATDFVYSATGKKIEQIEHVVIGGIIDHQYVIAWQYDALDRIIKLVEQPGTPDEKVTVYSYDASGKILTITKPDGTSLWHTYDALGRLTSLNSSDGTISYTYSYDLSNNPLEVQDKVSNHTYSYSYDAWNRRLTDGIKDIVTQSFTYDSLGRLTAIAAPDNSQVSYTYQQNHLHAISWHGHEHSYTAFDKQGRPTESSLIGQLGTLSMTWDKKGRTTKIASPYFTQEIPSNGFDAVGNLKRCFFTDAIGHVEQAAVYDDLYQLTQETGVQAHTYSNDSISNRLSKNSLNYTVDSTNKLLSASGDVFTYDKNGNLIAHQTSQNIIHFTYDALDRLIKVDDGTQQTTYIYDTFHRRIARSINKGAPQYFLHLGQREVGLWDPATKKLTEYRVLGLGKGAELGASVAIELNGNLYCPLHDHRGNIISLLDVATGRVAESYRYTAYGEHEVYNQNHEQIKKSALNNPWGFASKRLDAETGFVYFSRRYYAPVTGRWITPDPLGFADGPNMYAYVHNNPMTKFDLYGLFAYDDDYDSLEAAGLYGMMEASARTFVDFVSFAGHIIRSETVTNKCLEWHNSLDAFRGRYAETVSSMSGSNTSAQAVHQAIEAGVFARDSFDLSRLGLNLVKTASRNSAAILRAVSKEGQAVEGTIKLSAKKTAQVAEAGRDAFAPNKLPKDHMWTKSSFFKDKNADQLDKMFIKKGFRPKGPDPKNGLGNYINPKNERKYHIDPKAVGRYSEPNHVDVLRLDTYKGPLDKKRFKYQDD